MTDPTTAQPLTPETLKEWLPGSEMEAALARLDAGRWSPGTSKRDRKPEDVMRQAVDVAHPPDGSVDRMMQRGQLAMRFAEFGRLEREEEAREARRLREALDKVPSRAWAHAYHEFRRIGLDEANAMARADVVRIETERSIAALTTPDAPG